jgi:hypothetical protein
MIILGMFFFATLLVKDLLTFIFFARDEKFLTQRDAELDLTRHLKEG